MKTGLVLEGGAMRGMFTAGVLDVLMKEKIPIDGVVGASAGALFGVNLLSDQQGRAIRYNKRFNRDRNYLGLRPLLREGNVISTDYAYGIVPHHLDPFDDKRFKQSVIPYYAVATNIETGEPEYLQIKSVFEDMDSLRASGSMPFVSRPVEIAGKRYLDGGIADSIPFRWFASEGYDPLIVILTRDIEYRKQPMSPLPIRLYYRHYPNLQRQLLRRHISYNEAITVLKQWESRGRAFVIRPSAPIEISTLERDPQRMQTVYELGVKDARKQLPALKQYLQP